MFSTRDVQCVDPSGLALDLMDVVAAHTAPGHLHLACSAVVFGPDDNVLVQRRALLKPTFAGMWSNTCCTHPFPGEDPLMAAERRLAEELGVSLRLTPVGSFRYRAVDAITGMVEHELDHVAIGWADSLCDTVPDPSEVADTAWWPLHDVRVRIARAVDVTPWFDLVLRLAFAARGA